MAISRREAVLRGFARERLGGVVLPVGVPGALGAAILQRRPPGGKGQLGLSSR